MCNLSQPCSRVFFKVTILLASFYLQQVRSSLLVPLYPCCHAKPIVTHKCIAHMCSGGGTPLPLYLYGTLHLLRGRMTYLLTPLLLLYI